MEWRVFGGVSLSGVTPGINHDVGQCIASPCGVRPWEARRDTRDKVQSERGAAMMRDVDNAIVRAALAEQLADAFLETPWTAEAIAESAAGHIGGWPPWLEAL